MKTKTKFLGLLFGSIAIGTAAIVPAVTLSSCSSDGGAMSPSNVDFTPTTGITPATAENMQECTFAQAQDKLNQYFTTNASLERLNSDLSAFAKSISQTTPEGNKDEFFYKAMAGSKKNTINLYIKRVSTFKATGQKQEIYMSYYDIEVKPVIIKNSTGTFTCGWSYPISNYYNSWMITYSTPPGTTSKVDNIGIDSDFGGYFKKQDLINDIENKYKQNQSAFDLKNDGYILIQNMYSTIPTDPNEPDNPSTYKLIVIKNYNQPLKICEENNGEGVFTSSSMPLTFTNITDATSNMQPRAPQFTPPTFPKQ